MNKFLPYSHQNIDEDDVKAVIEVLKSDFITQGPKIKEFEAALSNYCGAKHAVVFSSGTAALHGAYFAAGIRKGHRIITSPITFLSTANAALFLGAYPEFVDIESETGNLNPGLVEEIITKETKAIVPVHYGGHPVELERIATIGKKHNLLIIEDASHALGAKYKGEKIGNCKYSDMCVFSFHPVKSITTGEGGAVLTNNEDYYRKLNMFRQHGITKKQEDFLNIDLAFSQLLNPWYYEMQFLGYNYRLTDIQCALGISQLKKLDDFVARRRKIVQVYKEAFKNNDFFDLPDEKEYVKSSWHLYPLRLKNKYIEKKVQIFHEMRKKELMVQVHYIPIYLQPYYQQLGYEKGLCPKAEDFYQREISIPLYQSMTKKDVNRVINTILRVFEIQGFYTNKSK